MQHPEHEPTHEAQIQVQVIDSSNQVLFTTSIEEIEKAYEYALEMEQMGIEVTIKSPSLPETLAQSLGAHPAHLKQLRDSVEHEIDSHGTTCCSDDLDNNTHG